MSWRARVAVVFLWTYVIALIFVVGGCTQSHAEVYSATVVRVLDGDTIEMDVKTFYDTTRRVTVRLGAVDTPELKATTECERTAAKAATEYVREWLGSQKKLWLVGGSSDKYGRTLAHVIGSERGNLSTSLIEAGHGRGYSGGHRKPWACTSN